MKENVQKYRGVSDQQARQQTTVAPVVAAAWKDHPTTAPEVDQKMVKKKDTPELTAVTDEQQDDEIPS